MGRKYPTPEGLVYPRMAGYNMACCDCGLVHHIVFEIVKLADPSSPYADTLLDEVITDPALTVRFRVTRNERSTGQMRRHNKIKVRRVYDPESNKTFLELRQESPAEVTY